MREGMGLLQTIDGDFDDGWARQLSREALEHVAGNEWAEATRHAWKSDEGYVGKQTHRGDCHEAASVRLPHEVSQGLSWSRSRCNVHSEYIFEQPQQIPWTPGVSASAFEIGHDPALTAEPALASPDIAFGLAQMFSQHRLVHGPHRMKCDTPSNAQVPTKFTE